MNLDTGSQGACGIANTPAYPISAQQIGVLPTPAPPPPPPPPPPSGPGSACPCSLQDGYDPTRSDLRCELNLIHQRSCDTCATASAAQSIRALTWFWSTSPVCLVQRSLQHLRYMLRCCNVHVRHKTYLPHSVCRNVPRGLCRMLPPSNLPRM